MEPAPNRDLPDVRQPLLNAHGVSRMVCQAILLYKML